MQKRLLSAAQIVALKKRFERCKTQILALDWVTQGSLSQSPQGNWRWTRKVKAKDRDGRPFRQTGRTFLPRHRRPSKARKTNRPDASH
jgi:hypothetical protein